MFAPFLQKHAVKSPTLLRAVSWALTFKENLLTNIMRTVKFRRLYGIGGNSSPWEDHGLEMFVLRAPELSFMLVVVKVMPPLAVLNDFFKRSESDGGMGNAVEWKPFEIQHDEYTELVEFLYTDPKRNIKLDDELDGICKFDEWRKKAVHKYNPRNRRKS
mgnify:FL=1